MTPYRLRALAPRVVLAFRAWGDRLLKTRVVIVLPESHGGGHSIAGQIADAIDCAVFTARGIRSGISLIAREKPEFAIFEQQLATVEGRPVIDVVAHISPSTHVVFIDTQRWQVAAEGTAAGE